MMYMYTCLAILSACVVVVSANTGASDVAMSRLERKVDILNTDMFELRVNLREERQLREQLETRLSEYITETPESNTKGMTATPTDNSQIMRDLEMVKAELALEQSKRVELESKVDDLQSNSVRVAAMQDMVTQFETFKSHTSKVTAMLRRALSTEKRHRYRVEREAKRLVESRTAFETNIRDALTNVQETIREEKQVREQTLDDWTEAVSRLEQSNTNITLSVCNVAGDQARRCRGQKTDQTGCCLRAMVTTLREKDAAMTTKITEMNTGIRGINNRINNSTDALCAPRGSSTILVCQAKSTIDGVIWYGSPHSMQYTRATIVNPNLAYKDRLSVVGDHTAGVYNLQIDNVEPSDAGMYQCRVDIISQDPQELTVKAVPTTVALYLGSSSTPVSDGHLLDLSGTQSSQAVTCTTDCASPGVVWTWEYVQRQISTSVTSVGSATSDVSSCTDGIRQTSHATVSRSSGLTGDAVVKCSALICGQSVTNNNLHVDFGVFL